MYPFAKYLIHLPMASQKIAIFIALQKSISAYYDNYFYYQNFKNITLNEKNRNVIKYVYENH